MQILLISMFISFLFYNFYFIVRFKGFPTSLSDTHYMDKRFKGNFFKVYMIVLAISLLPIWLNLTEKLGLQKYQIFAFLSCAGLMFLGAAAKFKHHERIIHFVATGITFIFSLLWIILTGNFKLYFICLVSCLTLFILFPKNYNESDNTIVYWVEVASFMTIFINLIFSI